ncbi:hypothetical protein JCM10207_006898 [Rhodosporidiobolus poonsookiae]
MPDTVTFLSSGHTPVEFTISRTALANSKVLSDLAALPVSIHNTDKPQLEEGPYELTPFFGLLQGEAVREDEMSEGEWTALARMSDKYDSEIVRSVVQRKGWQLAAQNVSPVLAFTLAAHVQDCALAKHCGIAALEASLCRWYYFQIPDPWLINLKTWRERLLTRALILYLDAAYLPPACGRKKCDRLEAIGSWVALGKRVAAQFRPRDPFVGNFDAVTLDCVPCKAELRVKAEELDKKYLDKLPEFFA